MLSLNKTEDKIDLDQAIQDYCEDCRGRVDGFVARHFSWAGAARLNRRALGADLLRVPLNIAWAPMWLFLQLLAWLASVGDWHRAAAWLRRIPAGFKTRVQRELTGLIEAELLNITAQQPDPLLPYLARQNLPEKEWQALLEQPFSEQQLTQFQQRLAGARIAVAEITSSVGMAVVGALFFNKFTPGALGGGLALAGWWSMNQSVSNFWAGEWAGRIWYAWFPPAVDWGTRLAATGVLMLILALVASLSGFFMDPIQKLLGFHRRRLMHLVDRLERELQQQLPRGGSTREQYLARVTDVIDWMVLAGRVG